MYKIFVGNLSYNATEDSIRSLFAAYGGVESVNLIRDVIPGSFEALVSSR